MICMHTPRHCEQDAILKLLSQHVRMYGVAIALCDNCNYKFCTESKSLEMCCVSVVVSVSTNTQLRDKFCKGFILLNINSNLQICPTWHVFVCFQICSKLFAFLVLPCTVYVFVNILK